jgi:hypothetical protein
LIIWQSPSSDLNHLAIVLAAVLAKISPSWIAPRHLLLLVNRRRERTFHHWLMARHGSARGGEFRRADHRYCGGVMF